MKHVSAVAPPVSAPDNVGEFQTRRRPVRADSSASRTRPPTYTAEEILEAIRRWARAYGEPPTMIDWEPARARRLGLEWRAERFESAPWPTVRMVRGRFDSFSAAIENAGLTARARPHRLRPHLSDPSAVLDAIVEWTRRYGDVPAMADWDPVRARRLRQDWRIARFYQGDWPSARTVINHFGSFGFAIVEAGCVPRPRSASSDERQQDRASNRRAAAEIRSAARTGGIQELAKTLRQLAAARESADPVALHSALIDVAASALAWAEIAGAELPNLRIS